MRKLAITAVLMFLAIGLAFSSGCAQEESEEAVDLFQGKDALRIDFVPGQPPSRILPNQQFPLAIELENYGGFDIPANTIQVRLSNAPILGLQTALKENQNDLPQRLKVNSDILPGGLEVVDYTDDANKAPKYTGPRPVEESPFIIQADVCYPYKQTIFFDVCVASSETDDICTTFGKKPHTATAGPIDVVGAEQLGSIYVEAKGIVPAHIRIPVYIDFKHIGSGDPYYFDREAIAAFKEITGEYQCFDASVTIANKDAIKIERIDWPGEEEFIDSIADRLAIALNKLVTYLNERGHKLDAVDKEEFDNLVTEEEVIMGVCGQDDIFVGSETTLRCEFIFPAQDFDYTDKIQIDLAYAYSHRVKTSTRLIPV